MNKAYEQDIELFTGHKQSLFKRTIYGISHLWFPYVCDVRSGAIFEIQLQSVKNWWHFSYLLVKNSKKISPFDVIFQNCGHKDQNKNYASLHLCICTKEANNYGKLLMFMGGILGPFHTCIYMLSFKILIIFYYIYKIWPRLEVLVCIFEHWHWTCTTESDLSSRQTLRS